MTNPIFSQWVVEYSVSQNAFHLHQVVDMIKKNLMAIKEERISDYLPIGVFETHESANRFIQSLKEEKYSMNNFEVITPFTTFTT